MSHKTQNTSNPSNTDESVEAVETVETDKADNSTEVAQTGPNHLESTEKWLRGINWTTEAYADEPDEDGDPVFLPTPDKTVIEAYIGANQSEKARIRTILTNVRDGYVRKMKGIQANNVQSTLDALFTPKPTKAAIDPFVLIAARVVNLREAANLLESGLCIPNGLNVDDRDFSELWAIVDQTAPDRTIAASYAEARMTRRSDKHDIQGVVDRAFEGLESGTFLTIAQIATRGALPDYKPGSGAIGAALFKSSGTPITGVHAEPMTATRPRGATKE